MHFYNPRLSAIDIEEARRYAGLATSKKTFPEHLLVEACAQAQLFISPKAVWEIYPYDIAFHTILAPEPLLLTSQSIIAALDGAVEAAVMAVTIGERLEEEVSEEFTRGSYTKALLLDAAGTAAVEQACDQTAALIARHAARVGCVAGKRFSPGYGDWDVSVQPDILRLSGATQIGVSVTQSMMLVPRKSVTAVIGIFPYQPSLQMPVMEKADCDDCPRPFCQARKESKSK